MNALELQGLTKHYKDFTLGPLDLTLPGGTICGLIGENGAGKSTTIRLGLRSALQTPAVQIARILPINLCYPPIRYIPRVAGMEPWPK